jgi:hypothetical protein
MRFVRPALKNREAAIALAGGVTTGGTRLVRGAEVGASSQESIA